MDIESKLTAKEALCIEEVIKGLLLKAQRMYRTQYNRFSIQIEAGEAYVIGHEEIPYKSDREQKLCKVTELLNGF